MLSLTLSIATDYSLARESSGMRLIESLVLVNDSDNPLDNLSLELGLIPELGDPQVFHLPFLESGERVDLSNVEFRLPAGHLLNLMDEEHIVFRCRVHQGQSVLLSADRPVFLRSHNSWQMGDWQQYASFVTPNHPVIAPLLKQVSQELTAQQRSSSLEGYQAKDPARVVEIVRALYSTLGRIGISYINPPANDWENGYQRIRLPDQVLSDLLGTCADLTPLAASCLEQMGLHSAICFVGGHVFPGVFLSEERAGQFPALLEDIGMVHSLIEAGELLLFDSSSYVHIPQPGFSEAVSSARHYLGSFNVLVNVYQCRRNGYRPLPVRMALSRDPEGEVLSLAQQLLRQAAASLPDPRHQGIEVSPEADQFSDVTVAQRFQRWKERLLDLSTRNRLLHLANLDVSQLYARHFAEATSKLLEELAQQVHADDPSASEKIRQLSSSLRTANLLAADFSFDRQLNPDLYANAVLKQIPEAWHPACLSCLQAQLGTIHQSIEGRLTTTLKNRKAAFLMLDLPPALLGSLEDLIAGGQAITLLGDTSSGEGDEALAITAAELAKGLCHTMHTFGSQQPLRGQQLYRAGSTLAREAKVSEEETGFSPLYLAFGLLQWREASGSAPRLAPLVLYPVQILVDGRNQTIRLQRTKAEPIGNITLVEKLKREADLELDLLNVLPQDANGVDIEKVLGEIRKAIANKSGWRVFGNAVVTSFSFGKFLLWRDLQDNTDELLSSDTVRHIATAGRDPFPDPLPDLKPSDLDHQSYIKLPLVVASDSSQLAAVHAAMGGRSFVLQGPPGTGKSQTITNLIAAAMAAGKTVLFVAEKAAAVEVVHRRLKAVGLGSFCLDLHRPDSNMEEVLQSFNEALQEQEGSVDGWNGTCEELESLRGQLRRYAEALHEQQPIGASIFQMLAEISRQPALPALPPELNVADLTAEAFAEQLQQIRQFAQAHEASGDSTHNPWRFVGPLKWSLGLDQRLEHQLSACIRNLTVLRKALRPFHEQNLVAQPVSWPEVESLLALGKDCPWEGIPTLATDLTRWEPLRQKAERWFKTFGKHEEAVSQLRMRWKGSAFERNLEQSIRHLDQLMGSFLLVRWFGSYFLRRRLKPLAHGPLPSLREIRNDLRSIHDSHLLQKQLEVERAELIAELPEWSGDSERLISLLSRTASVTRLLAKHDDAARRLAAIRDCSFEDWQALISSGSTAREELNALAAIFNLEKLPLAHLATESLDSLEGWLHVLQLERPLLRSWCQHAQIRQAFAASALGPLLAWEQTADLPLSTFAPTYRAAVLKDWFNRCFDAEAALREFNTAVQTQRLERFRSLETQFLELSRQVVRAAVVSRMPNRQLKLEGSELGELKREIAKKRNRQPVRALFRRIPTLLSGLKPCLLASPISVARFLPAEGKRFDLVIFDEASQVETHDAIGAIARGKQVVIVGDNKQMPPTNFFSRTTTEADELADVDCVEDLESILDEAMACRLPEQMLEWHYRSRHESLITFSNEHYYRDKLNVFPSSLRPQEDLGLQWHAVPNAFYQSGSRVNRAEAEELVNYLVKRLLAYKPGERSFGIVTFNTPQQLLIESLLQNARQRQPDLEPWFNKEDLEYCFVKNLETVQGDERDEVLFSICYGPQRDGKLSMSFGALNRHGGERRLNVAVTRARSALHVFSTLEPEQIDLSRTNAVAVRHLREFLGYVRRQGQNYEHVNDTPRFDTDLQRQIFEVLTAAGHRVACKVGCANYQIDLAVIDPADPCRFRIGIECDGDSYASAETVRDRDYLRQNVLQQLGWQLHRVWSIDWLLNRAAEEKRLIEAVEAALSGHDLPPVPVVLPTLPASAGVMGQQATQVGNHPDQGLRVSSHLGRPYKVAELAPVSETFQDFYLEQADGLLAQRMVELVSVEAPICFEAAARRIAQCWNCRAFTARAADRVRAVAVNLSRSSRLFLDGQQVLWIDKNQSQQWMGFRAAPSAGRSLDQIPEVEIKESMLGLTREALSMEPETLLREIHCQLTGNLRFTQQKREILEAVLNHLLSEGRLLRLEDRLFAATDD